MPHDRPAVRWLILGIATVIAGVFVLRTVLPATQRNTYAFSVYYTSARLVLQNEADSRLCSEWFFEKQRALGLRADTFCGAGPPTMALVLAPVAWLRPDIARVVWVAFDLVILALMSFLAWRIARIYNWLTNEDIGLFVPGAFILVAVFQPVAAELWAGQIHLFLAALYAIWLYGYVTRHDWICGIALAGLALAKLAAAPIWLLMLVTGRGRALLIAGAIMLTVLAVTMPVFTLRFWMIDLQTMFMAASQPQSAVPAAQTILSLLRQVFDYNKIWTPRPLVDIPWLVSPLYVMSGATLLAITLWLGRKDNGIHAAMAALCICVPIQPAGEQYHYALLFTVLLVALVAMRKQENSVFSSICLFVALLLFMLPSYFLRTEVFNTFPISLLAYPRLYGALILWGALIKISAERPRLFAPTKS